MILPVTFRAKDLVKNYRKYQVIKGISLEIKTGEIVGLLGPNGAGKTTTFYMLVGIEQPNQGEIFLGEKEITRKPMYWRARGGISYLPQEPSVLRNLTVQENILLYLENQNLSHLEMQIRLKTLLEEFQISHLAKAKAATLSGGERRRLEIARALATNPSFILLDEPFTGVDPIAVFEIQKMISNLKAKGFGIIITDHSVRETLEITDRAYLMYEGKILISGTSKELVRSEKAREIYLGKKFTLAKAPIKQKRRRYIRRRKRNR